NSILPMSPISPQHHQHQYRKDEQRNYHPQNSNLWMSPLPRLTLPKKLSQRRAPCGKRRRSPESRRAHRRRLPPQKPPKPVLLWLVGVYWDGHRVRVKVKVLLSHPEPRRPPLSPSLHRSRSQSLSRKSIGRKEKKVYDLPRRYELR